MITFEQLGLNAEVLSAIQSIGYEKPTSIQEKAIPHLLNNTNDLIAFAQTGTGKTAAFGLPLVQLVDHSITNTQALILCPTRELCIQIANDLEAFSKNIPSLHVLPVYGGASIEPQIRALKKGAQIVVGTPGRTNDLINKRKLDITNINYLVLDEADEMLTMGFKDELDAILSTTPYEKQTLLFSATMPSEIVSITKNYMNNPDRIEAGKMNQGADTVEHIYYQAHARDRYLVLKRIADINPNIYGIIFCRTRMETKEVANKLMHDGYNADALHGDLSQAQRDEVMGRFRSKHLQLLVATDVAARGLDVDNLSHVINYNLPDEPEVYIHRSGRTGRAGRKGISIAIIHGREISKIKTIEKKSNKTFERKDIPNGEEICQVQLYSLIEKLQQVQVDDHQIEPYMPEIHTKLASLTRDDLVKRLVSVEFNRFLSYYKNSPDLNLKEGKGNRDEKGERGPKRRERSNEDFERFHINVGSKHNLAPARLIGLINEALDSSKPQIGKIEVLRQFSFFEIEKTYAKELSEKLNTMHFGEVAVKVEVSKGGPREQERDERPRSKKSSGRRDGRGTRNESADWNFKPKKGRGGSGRRGKGRRR
ncbi:MAG: DEAD/DEAH box helicase [Cyclobacteriaceae bacterium]|nr:DEAD/DEAH box helicase [Cyclobacteriaceae bacterium]